MKIKIRPFTSEHVEAMKAFNRRLAQGGGEHRFSESPVSGWLPRREEIPLYQETSSRWRGMRCVGLTD